jgi:rhodanese-related sulfurtransferase
MTLATSRHLWGGGLDESVELLPLHDGEVVRAPLESGARKEGLYVHYRLASPAVFTLLRSVRTVAEAQLADMQRVVDTYLEDRKALDAVGREELLERARGGEVVVVDVRPAEEYAAGHIPGALSLPITELEARLEELPRRREVVAYCRGPYCVWADEAVRLLRAHGRKARRLHEGFPEWRAAGLPTEAVEEPAP